MENVEIEVDGWMYPVAPLDPEMHDRPSPAFPIVITPAVAQSWLRYNWRNRNKRGKGINDYSADMTNDRFDLNGTTITFSRPLGQGEDPDVPGGKPVLIDGQHRLESCVKSGKPFLTYVIYGLDPTARRTVDGGIKRRFQDILQMDGEVKTDVLSSVTARCFAWTIGDRHLTLKRAGMTKAALEGFLKEHPELRRSVDVAVQVHGDFIGSGIRKSVVGTAHWLLMQADPTVAPEFFIRLGDGAEMPKDHPIMVLRRRIMKDKTDREARSKRDVPHVPDWQQLCYIIRTWNALMEDKSDFALVSRYDHQRMPVPMTAVEIDPSKNVCLSLLVDDDDEMPKAS
jgi:hypothetical protein